MLPILLLEVLKQLRRRAPAPAPLRSKVLPTTHLPLHRLGQEQESFSRQAQALRQLQRRHRPQWDDTMRWEPCTGSVISESLVLYHF